jgi:hypothetical protein
MESRALYRCRVVEHELIQSDSADLSCLAHGVPLLLRAAGSWASKAP